MAKGPVTCILSYFHRGKGADIDAACSIGQNGLGADLRRILESVCCVALSSRSQLNIRSFCSEWPLAPAPDFRCGHNECLSCGQTDLRFLVYADAASFRICGTFVVATRRKSPVRSFASVDFARTEKALSLRLCWTSETRTLLPCGPCILPRCSTSKVGLG